MHLVTRFIVFCYLFSCVWCDYNYCKIECNGQKHTMCIYSSVSSSCKAYRKKTFSQSEKQLILDEHNRYRRIIATGRKEKEEHPLQPKASNMLELVWNEELATIAQRWADQCKFQHDKCRDSKSFRSGQNLALKWSTNRFEMPIKGFIFGWYDEVKKFNTESVYGFRFERATGHYTQMIWAKTQYVGCGASYYEDSIHGANRQVAFLVCNYGPSGNVRTMKIYEVGEPCSTCPAGSKCKDGLCFTGKTGSMSWKHIEENGVGKSASGISIAKFLLVIFVYFF